MKVIAASDDVLTLFPRSGLIVFLRLGPFFQLVGWQIPSIHEPLFDHADYGSLKGGSGVGVSDEPVHRGRDPIVQINHNARHQRYLRRRPRIDRHG